MNSGRYYHWQKIGEGAYGIVYKAIDSYENREVAIKKVHLPALAEKQGAALMQKIHHPSCPKIIDCFENDDFCFIVMQYLNGNSLRCFQGKLSSHLIRKLLKDMLAIMAEMDRHQMTYNDFKPDNIIFDGKHFYLIDFGAVMPYQSIQPRFGSRAFASPEYLAGENVDWRSDLYSLAKTAQAAAGKQDFILRFWIRKSLRQNPDQRFKSIEKAKHVLRLRVCVCFFILFAILCLLACYQPLQGWCYQKALYDGNLELCIQIDAGRKEAFEAYLSSHDPLQYSTWITLWQWQLPGVRDSTFLWQCFYQLSLLSDDFSWQLQEEIIVHLKDEKAVMYQSLLAASEISKVKAFASWARNREDRIFLYRYCLFQSTDTLSGLMPDFRTWLAEDGLLSEEEKDLFLAHGALKVMDESMLKEIYAKMLPLTNEDYVYLKAKMACTLFETGHYQEGWLHQAEKLLREYQEDAQCQDLYAYVTEKIKQWGSNS